MKTTYYRVFDTQRGIYFATGYNAESMKDLVYQFKHYIAGGMDRPSSMSWCTSWVRIVDWLQGSVLEKSSEPFNEDEIL